MSKFADNFWSTEFCSTQGYDTLVKRLKDGKRMCQDFEEYLEKRAKIERDYGESLIKLSRTTSGKEEIGSLRKSWDTLRSDTDTIGQLHVGLAQTILEQVHHTLKEFREQQRDIRKKSEDTVKRAAQHKKKCYDKNNTLKNTYDSRCKEADKMEENSNKLHANPQTKPNTLTQAARRMETSRQSANNADTTYQESVRNLEESRQLWEREMEILCKQFQELEEQRIAYLRHQMWTYTNLLSKCTVDIDTSCESTRKSLEECDVDADIDLFVSGKAVGSGRPQAVQYINYYNPDTGPSVVSGVGTRTGVGVSLSSSHIPPPPQKALPPTPIDAISRGQAVAPDAPDVYSTIGETMNQPYAPESDYYSAPKQHDTVVAVYAYEAQGSEELELVEGDVITLISREDDVWWCGQLSDGRKGMFPSAYVQGLEGDDP
ncbi:proline-serine-threonine phosphatase-interacting protein 1-like [Halichondria panicea]|uniref:proline-serine-threonine phosphatase-interacting protein 1-like n=1 Tax=Halichondria panicea TaxID=6063 RepID=UPI00312BBEE9